MPDYAQYGISPYGTARYGKAPVSDLALSLFEADPDYTSVGVQWGKPTGLWDRLRLVRGAYGYATDEIDGRILVDVVAASDPGFYRDTNVDPLRFYYYTIFLRQTSDQSWVRAGNAVCLVPKDYHSSARLYELTPQIFRDGDLVYTVAPSASPYAGRGMLETFLSLFGDMTNTLRSELETLLWVNDVAQMSGGLLPALAAELGLPYEAELGMAQVRRQIANIVYLYKMKGTQPGIEGAVYAFSGWAANVSAEVNRMLSNDDAAFEFSTGHWSEFSNVALSTQTAAGAVSNSGNGVMVMTALAAGNIEARLPVAGVSFAGPPSLPLLLNGSTPQQYPPNAYGAVLPDASGGASFTFSAYFKPVTTTRTVLVRLLFYDQANTLLSMVTGPNATEISGSFVRATVTGAAPTTAHYAAFALVGVGAAAKEQHQVDALQFEAGASATTWFPANGVKINLLADRVNLSDNPSFEVSTANWTPAGCTLTWVTPASPYVGTAVGQVSTTAGARVAGIQTTNLIPVTAELAYAFSAYWMAVTTGRPVVNTVTWYDAGSQMIGSVASGPQISLPLLFNPFLPASDVTAVWTRVPLIVFAPANAVSCRFTTAVMAPTGTFGAGEAHYVDGVLIEQADTVGDYFDASTGTPLADYRWEGVAHLSRSHYYHRRAVRESRLTVRLPDFLPAGSSYRILDAQPV